MSRIGENSWIEQIAKGDQNALSMLYSRYSDKVYNTALGYLKSQEDAEELLQDVFVTIYNTSANFRFDSSVSTWVYRITVNKSLDFLRKKTVKKEVGFSPLFTAKSRESSSLMRLLLYTPE